MKYLKTRVLTGLAVTVFISFTMSFIWIGKLRLRTHLNSKLPSSQTFPFQTGPGRFTGQTQFDCNKLFEGDRNETKRALDYVRDRNRTSLHGELTQMPFDCKVYKRARGYIMKPFEKEDDFPIAFNILFHRGFEQLERLLRAIYRSQHQFCIHVDKKTPADSFYLVKSLADCFDNVFIASKLEIMIYEGYTRLIADINCMEDHIARKFAWKYLINMAASEFPLLSNKQIVQVLNELNGFNDIEEVLNHTNELRYRIKHFTYIFPGTNDGRMIHTRERKKGPPHGLTITKGNAYGIFNRAFVEFLLKDNISRDLLKWLEDTSVSEEHFWATLNNLYNNPFLETPGGYRGKPDEKPYFARFIAWNRTSQKEQCLDRHYIHNICVFSVLDLPMLKDRHEIIANKFDIEYDPVVYRCMEELIHNRTIRQDDIADLNVYRQYMPSR